jgi:hypothetical protein
MSNQPIVETIVDPWVEVKAEAKKMGFTPQDVRLFMLGVRPKQSGQSSNSQQADNPYLTRVRQMWEAKMELDMMKSLGFENESGKNSELEDLRRELRDLKNSRGEKPSFAELAVFLTASKDTGMKPAEIIALANGNFDRAMQIAEKMKGETPEPQDDPHKEKLDRIIDKALDDALNPEQKKSLAQGGLMNLTGKDIKDILESVLSYVPKPKAPPAALEGATEVVEPVVTPE